MGNKTMSRLFTFGCSFTFWPWPTWADIIAHDLEIPYYNWGMSGLGNVAIQSRMLECDLRNNFTKDDIILVVWSSWTREDRYDVEASRFGRPSWTCHGDILLSYDKKFIANHWSINNDIVKNSTAIISANRMVDIKFNGHISEPITNPDCGETLYFGDHEKTIASLYEPHIPHDGSYQEGPYLVGGHKPVKHPCRYTKTRDVHPDILSHLDYVREFIAPKLGRQLSKKTIDYFTEMHYGLLDFTENVMDTSDGIDYRAKIPAVLEQFNWTNKNLEGF